MSEPEPSSVEEAVELFLARRQRGEALDPVAFSKRYAHLGSDVHDAIDALLELERTDRGERSIEEDLARIGPYRVVRELGRGGMGVVLEAIEEPLGRRVALKILPAHALQSAEARARFRREAELAARLDHSGIATVFGTGVAEERPWIAMRFVDGENLARSITRAREDAAICARIPGAPGEGRDAVSAIAACIARVARALHAAHAQGVVHRDVKPSNILIGSDGCPVLVDFGLAIPEEATGASLTRTGDTAGTPAYIAPEIVSGERSRPDAQSDVYALGVTLYECLSLRRPFDGPTPVALYRAIATSSATDVRSLNPGVPRDLAVIVATAMERDRQRRYASAAAMADDLEAFVAQRPIRARAEPLHGRVLRWARREPRQAVLAAALFAATVALATFGGVWWSSRDEVLAASAFAARRAFESALEEGFASLDRGRPAEAEAAFVRAQALDPTSDEPGAGRVLASVTAGNFAAARAHVASLAPSMRGRDALHALAFETALPSRGAAEFAPEVGSFELYIRGRCVVAEGQRRSYYERGPLNQRALALFSEAVLRAPVARAIYHEQRASGAQQAGNAEVARSASAALVSLWPDSARALYYAGQALVQIDPAAARPLLERSLALDPTPVDTYNLIIQTLQGPDDHHLAEAWCWRGLALHPRSSALYVLLGNALTMRGCNDEGTLAHQRATELDPRRGVSWSQCAVDALLKGELGRAVDLYSIALSIDPMNHTARVFQAAALEKSGRLVESARAVEFAIAGVYPSDAASWKLLSAVLLQIGAPRAASTYIEAGLTVAPTDPDLVGMREEAAGVLAK